MTRPPVWQPFEAHAELLRRKRIEQAEAAQVAAAEAPEDRSLQIIARRALPRLWRQ